MIGLIGTFEPVSYSLPAINDNIRKSGIPGNSL